MQGQEVMCSAARQSLTCAKARLTRELQSLQCCEPAEQTVDAAHISQLLAADEAGRIQCRQNDSIDVSRNEQVVGD